MTVEDFIRSMNWLLFDCERFTPKEPGVWRDGERVELISTETVLTRIYTRMCTKIDLWEGKT